MSTTLCMHDMRCELFFGGERGSAEKTSFVRAVTNLGQEHLVPMSSLDLKAEEKHLETQEPVQLFLQPSTMVAPQ